MYHLVSKYVSNNEKSNSLIYLRKTFLLTCIHVIYKVIEETISLWLNGKRVVTELKSFGNDNKRS